MRTLIDIPDDDLKALDQLGERGGVSRAKLVRQAISDYLAKTYKAQIDTAFGLWRDRAEDGVDYQRRVRSEW
jgi:metal-responsive CopG/Arc/MetJ family transcriptional regulator